MLFKIVDNTKKFGNFNCRMHMLAFYFEDFEHGEAPKWSNPFFNKDERKREIAKIIFSDDSELIKAPQRHMTFDGGNIEVIALDWEL